MSVKRLVAKRKLQRKCIYCETGFKKGDVYYKQRHIYDCERKIIAAYEYLICPKCKWQKESNNKRFDEFKKVCRHPSEFEKTEYGYIPGECVMEPKYSYCGLCGEILIGGR